MDNNIGLRKEKKKKKFTDNITGSKTANQNLIVKETSPARRVGATTQSLPITLGPTPRCSLVLKMRLFHLIVTATLSPTASHCVPHPPSPARHALHATHFFIYLFPASFPCAATHAPSNALVIQILPRMLPVPFLFRMNGECIG